LWFENVLGYPANVSAAFSAGTFILNGTVRFVFSSIISKTIGAFFFISRTRLIIDRRNYGAINYIIVSIVLQSLYSIIDCKYSLNVYNLRHFIVIRRKNNRLSFTTKLSHIVTCANVRSSKPYNKQAARFVVFYIHNI